MASETLFARSLQQALKDAGLSVSEVAKRMQLRSRNSLFRILKGETSPRLNRKFLADMQSSLPDVLTQTQWQQLWTALDITDTGEKEYRSQTALMQLVRPMSEITHPAQVHYLDAEGVVQSAGLTAYLSDLTRRATQVNLLMFGCCDQLLIRQLQAGLHACIQRGVLSINHYVYVGEEEAMENIIGIQPIADMPYYSAFLVDQKCCSAVRARVYRVGRLILDVTRPDDSRHVETLLRMDDHLFMAAELSAEAQWLSQQMQQDAKVFPLLHPQWQLTNSMDDFVTYTRQYGEIERNVGIYIIRPDILFQMIPVDVILPVAQESFSQLPIAPEEQAAVLAALAQIHADRVDNMLTKRKPTYQLMSFDQMKQFVQTGRESDHFYVLRPFTIAERRRILTFLRNTAATNPYYHLFFTTERLPLSQREIALYDGRALLTMNATSQYNINSDHTECHIAQPFVLSEYKKFFMNTLIKQYAFSESVSLQILDELISMLPED